MDQVWQYIIDLGIISVLLIVAVFIKRKVVIFRNYPIPVPIIAGFLGLILGKDILNLIHFNGLHLENMVYHLMNIGFVSLSLKTSSKLRSKEYVNSGLFIVSNYVLQGIVGFGLSMLLFLTLFQDTFPLFGLLLPLGYGQGPGQAYAMGKQWEFLGFTNGGNTGLTIAAFGYIWACAGGVALTAYLTKTKKMMPKMNHIANKEIKETVFDEDKITDLPLKESIDGLTLQLILIGMVYLLTYLTLSGAQSILITMGDFGATLAQMLWGFSFIIGAMLGMLVRRILDFCLGKGWMKNSYTSNYILERIAGGSFDFMITAAISAISIYLLKDYFIPLFIVTTVGGLVTIFYIVKLGKRIYPEDTIENILAMYGM